MSALPRSDDLAELRSDRGEDCAPVARPLLPEEASARVPRGITALERAVFDTLQMANSSQRNRTLGYLLGFALRALEVGEIEERLAALESLVGRGGPRIA